LNRGTRKTYVTDVAPPRGPSNSRAFDRAPHGSGHLLRPYASDGARRGPGIEREREPLPVLTATPHPMRGRRVRVRSGVETVGSNYGDSHPSERWVGAERQGVGRNRAHRSNHGPANGSSSLSRTERRPSLSNPCSCRWGSIFHRHKYSAGAYGGDPVTLMETDYNGKKCVEENAGLPGRSTPYCGAQAILSYKNITFLRQDLMEGRPQFPTVLGSAGRTQRR